MTIKRSFIAMAFIVLLAQNLFQTTRVQGQAAIDTAQRSLGRVRNQKYTIRFTKTIKPVQSKEDRGPESIWDPTDKARAEALQKCKKEERKTDRFVKCVLQVMKDRGATDQAIEFTRLLKGEGFMISFKETGKVDVAAIFSPFKDPPKESIVFMNGRDKLMKIDDPNLLRKIDLTGDPQYPSLIKKFPKMALWPGNPELPRAETSPEGGQRFLVNYHLLNGCFPCEFAGTAQVAFDFDEGGKFLGPRLVFITPKPILPGGKPTASRKTP